MNLTPEQRGKVLEALSKVWPAPRTCPACTKPGPWAINDSLFEFRSYDKGIALGGPIIPVVTCHCGVCGYVMVFGAIRLGLVDPSTGEWSGG